MTAPPLDPTGADRRLRIVFLTVPGPGPARELRDETVRLRLAARASSWPIQSTRIEPGGITVQEEWALLVTTSAKKLGALLRHLARRHPERAPQLLELHVPRVNEPFARWLLGAIDPDSFEPSIRPRPLRRPAAPRGRAAPSRPRIRGQPLHR
ncbi:MAG: divalent cation tolerance protein CutA [Thermoplasmata archaeon]